MKGKKKRKGGGWKKIHVIAIWRAGRRKSRVSSLGLGSGRSLRGSCETTKAGEQARGGEFC